LKGLYVEDFPKWIDSLASVSILSYFLNKVLDKVVVALDNVTERLEKIGEAVRKCDKGS
jgi:hypothetical protein